MNQKYLGKGAIVATLTAVLALPVVATADTDAIYEDTSIKVNFADLDTGSAAGIHTLYKRLQDASEEACGSTSYSDVGNLSMLQRNKRCYQETLSNSVEKVGSEALSELHNS